MSLQATSAEQGDILIVKVTGELDHHTAPIIKDFLETEMTKPHLRHLLLNFEQLEFMDSSGIGMILGRYKQVVQKGGKMGICGLHPAIHRLLEMSGLFKILIVGDDERHALSRLEVMAR